MAATSTSPITSLGATAGGPSKHQNRYSTFTSRTSASSRDTDYHDSELDVSFTLAIIAAYTPPPTPTTALSTSASDIDTPFCTHTLVKRQRVSREYECEGCMMKHWMGWMFKCELCQAKGCQDCRGHWVERTFGALDGVVLSPGDEKSKSLARRGSLMSVGSLGTVGSMGSSGNDSVRPGPGAKRMSYRTEEIDMGFELEYELIKMLL